MLIVYRAKTLMSTPILYNGYRTKRKIKMQPNLSRTQSNSANFFSVEILTDSQLAIASNDNREGLLIFNDSDRTALVSFVGDASADHYSFKITPQGYYETGTSTYTGAVNVVWLDEAQDGTGRVLVTELEG